MYIDYEIEKIEPPINMSPYREVFGHTRDTYVEYACDGCCVRCMWCNPRHECDPCTHTHLITNTGHFVSRLGYCYCKGHDISFDRHDGCEYYKCETKRKIIHEETMTYEQQDKLKKYVGKIGYIGAMKELESGRLFDGCNN